MEAFVSYVVKEWAVIRQAPGIFILAIIVVGGILYGAMNFRYDGVIDGLTQRLNLRDDQIAQLKEKVGTASPDEIKSRIANLEAQIKSISPRRLTDAQRNGIATLLKTNPGNIEIENDMSVADGRSLASDIITAFQIAGWSIRSPSVLGPSNPPPHGFGLRVTNPGALTPRQALIVQALNFQGIQFDLQQGDMDIGMRVPPGQSTLPPLDAIILITQKVL